MIRRMVAESSTTRMRIVRSSFCARPLPTSTNRATPGAPRCRSPAGAARRRALATRSGRCRASRRAPTLHEEPTISRAIGRLTVAMEAAGPAERRVWARMSRSSWFTGTERHGWLIHDRRAAYPVTPWPPGGRMDAGRPQSVHRAAAWRPVAPSPGKRRPHRPASGIEDPGELRPPGTAYEIGNARGERARTLAFLARSESPRQWQANGRRPRGARARAGGSDAAGPASWYDAGCGRCAGSREPDGAASPRGPARPADRQPRPRPPLHDLRLQRGRLYRAHRFVRRRGAAAPRRCRARPRHRRRRPPGLKGADLLQAISSKQPDVRIVVTSAAATESLALTLREQVYGHLKQPFAADEVQQLVDRLNDERRPPKPTSQPVPVAYAGGEGLARLAVAALEESDAWSLRGARPRRDGRVDGRRGRCRGAAGRRGTRRPPATTATARSPPGWSLSWAPCGRGCTRRPAWRSPSTTRRAAASTPSRPRSRSWSCSSASSR